MPFELSAMNRLLLASLCACLAAASSIPTPATLPTTDDESVVGCVAEVVSRAISDASPAPATDNCVRVLREDERINGFLHRKDLMQMLQQLSKHAETTEAPYRREAKTTGVRGSGATRSFQSDKEEEKSFRNSAEWLQHRGEEVRGGAAGTGSPTSEEHLHLVKQEERGHERTHDDDDDDDDNAAVVNKRNINYRSHSETRRKSKNPDVEEKRVVAADYEVRHDGLERDAAEPRAVTARHGDADERAGGHGNARSIENENPANLGEGGRHQTGEHPNDAARFPERSSDESESERPTALTLSEQERNADVSRRDRHDDRRAGDDRGDEERRSSRESAPRASTPRRRAHEDESEGDKVEEELIRMTLQNDERKAGAEEPARRPGSAEGPERNPEGADAAMLAGESNGSDATPGFSDAAVAKRDSAAAADAARHAGRKIDSDGSSRNPHGAEDRAGHAAQSSSEEDKELAEIAAMELELENIVNKIEDLKRG